jgi:hypothetical protein
MKPKPTMTRITFAVALFLVALLTSIAAYPQASQARAPELNLSAEEQTMAKAIMSAPDATGKLKAAEALINKHPKTLIRLRVAEEVADQIAQEKDAAQRIQLASEYQKTFTQESEHNLIMPVLVTAYADAGQSDQAFTTGAAFLGTQPNSLRVLTRLTFAATEEAKKRNAKFIEPGTQYGAKAIDIIEADKKPDDMSDTVWGYYKTLRPSLYQSVASLNLMKGNRAEAKARFTKAAELAPTEPFNHLMLAGIVNDEYNTEAQRIRAMPEGQAKQDAMQNVLLLLDQVIDAYARMLAVSESDARFAQVRQGYMQDFETYYKYRHHSTEGMQQLIDKYKVKQ